MPDVVGKRIHFACQDLCQRPAFIITNVVALSTDG